MTFALSSPVYFDPRSGLWRCASLDPPWPEKGGGGRGAQNHYDVADALQIRNAILNSGKFRPMEHSHLWCWYTDNYLLQALWLVRELGFEYKRTFQWVKVKGEAAALDFETGLAVVPPADGILVPDDSDLVVPDTSLETDCGIGQYGRGAHEGMLFCTRGRGMDPSVYTTHRDVPSAFLAPVPKKEGTKKKHHSRKPDASYELIQRRSHGPYMEFFARREFSPEWSAWGAQAPGQAA